MASTAPDLKTVADFRQRARQFGAVVVVSEFETTPASIQRSVSNTISAANAMLDLMCKRDRHKLTFANTVGILENATADTSLVAARLWVIKNAGTNAATRTAAAESLKTLRAWAVGVQYREDVYAALKSFADTRPKLNAEDARLLAITMQDFTRAGMNLPKAKRDELQRSREELERLRTVFEENLNAAPMPTNSAKNDDEQARRQLFIAKCNRAAKENEPVVQRMLELRNDIAHGLGYASWADFAIELRMAKSAAAAQDFCGRLSRSLQPEFSAELKELAAMKAADTGDSQAQIEWWDTDYYGDKLKREKYHVSSDQLRAFFPYQRVLNGLFSICEQSFGLKIERVEPDVRWVDALEVIAISDASTGKPLGLVYLDMFSREGKNINNQEFALIPGRRLTDGKLQCPVAVLFFHFSRPPTNAPLLLSLGNVENLFHEFGHALHDTLTRAAYARFAGTQVPRDFVEAPALMMQRWARDKRLLDTFAVDYRNETNTIPLAVLNQLKAAKLAMVGINYRWQLAWALSDLAVHTQVKEGVDSVKLSNQILSDVFLPLPEGTASLTQFELLSGYDAACYGYPWSEILAADMATVFEKSSGGFLDRQIGLRFRQEIFEPGNSRDVNESVRKFLGRPPAIEPFLGELGLATGSNSAVAK